MEVTVLDLERRDWDIDREVFPLPLASAASLTWFW